jgi:threonine dehydratase
MPLQNCSYNMTTLNSPSLLTVADVEKAAQAMRGRIDDTPFLFSETLSEITGAQLWLKFENLQFTGSFKQRGALNKLLSLNADQCARGVIAVSAGNHAQGVAYHAGQLGIPATIIMPVGTPAVKAQRTAKFGAEVVFAGTDFAEASAALPSIMQARRLTEIHPFDDDLVIAGQGTVALEMIRDQPDMDALLVSVGGGGLISGIAIAARAMSPKTEIIGVESAHYPSMATHMGLWSKPGIGGASIAEGIAVATPGIRTAQHAKALVSDIIVVDEATIERAIALLLQIEKTLCEGAGAAGLAAILAQPERFAGRKIGLVLCGGNIDNRLLTAILQRQLVRDQRLFRLRVQLSDQAGTLGQLCTEVGLAGGNINSVAHDRTFLANDAKSARVELEIEVADPDTRSLITDRLEALGFHIS